MMTQDMIDGLLKLGKKKRTRGFVFQKQTRTYCWKIASDEPTIEGVVADTTGFNPPPPPPRYQKNDDIGLEETFE